MASSQASRKVNGRATEMKFTASHPDKRRRNRTYIDPREIQRSQLKAQADSWVQRRVKSNIDPADVLAATELRRIQSASQFLETQSLSNSRCNSWASLNSFDGGSNASSLSGSRQDLSFEIPAGFGNVLERPQGFGSPLTVGDNDSGIMMLTGLEIPLFNQKRRKLPRTPNQRSPPSEHLPRYMPPPPRHTTTSQHQDLAPRHHSDPNLKVRPETWHSNDVDAAANDAVVASTPLRPNSFHATPVHSTDLDADDADIVPLRAEETSFEGVTLSHLQRLQELQMQQQYLMLEEARLKSNLAPPPLCYSDAPPSYGQSMDAGSLSPPPPHLLASLAHQTNDNNVEKVDFTVDASEISDLLSSSNFGS